MQFGEDDFGSLHYVIAAEIILLSAQKLLVFFYYRCLYYVLTMLYWNCAFHLFEHAH